MAFRNPIRTLPASAIIGQIPGSQISGPVAQATNATNATNATAALSATAVTGVGTVPYTALSVGTGNLVPDPSFEGAYAASLATGVWSIDTPGNNSPKAMKLTTSGGGFPSKKLTTIPVIPGEQYYLAFDYKVGATWSGTNVNLNLAYRDGTGAQFAFSVAADSAPVLGGSWKRVTGLFTVPSGAVSADIQIQQAGSSTAGTTWWDNIEVRTAVVAGAIAAGIITAGMLSADAVDGRTITGSTLRTAATGNRIVIHTGTGAGGQSIGLVELFTEGATDLPGSIIAAGPVDGVTHSLELTAPKLLGNPNPAPYITLNYDPDSAKPRVEVNADTAYLPHTSVGGDISVTGHQTVNGVDTGAGIQSQVSISANVTGITATEVALMTLPSMTFKNGRAYQVTLWGLASSTTAGTYFLYRLRKGSASTTGTIYKDQIRVSVVGTASVNSAVSAVFTLVNTSGADITTAVTWTASCAAGTGIFAASSSNLATATVEDIGLASQWTGQPIS